MSYLVLQKKAANVEADLKVVCVWINAAEKEVDRLAEEDREAEKEYREAKRVEEEYHSEGTVTISDWFLVVNVRIAAKMKWLDVKTKLTKAEEKLAEFKEKKRELTRLYDNLIKQMEGLNDNVLQFRRGRKDEDRE